MSSSAPALDPDTIDDILFCARANELSDLRALLSTSSSSANKPHRAILEAAIDPETGNSALHMAAANGHTDMLKFLLGALDVRIDESEADSNHTHSNRTEPSSQANPNSQSRVLNHTNTSHNTALHWAALNGHVDSTRLLLASGANAEAKNIAGRDAGEEALRNGHDEVVALIEGWGGEGEIDGVGGDDSKDDRNEESSVEEVHDRGGGDDKVEEVVIQAGGMSVGDRNTNGA